MNLEKVAYIFDTSILGECQNCPVNMVLSFACSPLYLKAYAKEAAEKIDLSSLDSCNFYEWLKLPKNSDSLAPFLMKLYDDFGKLGASTFFIEKDYTLFLYLVGVMMPSIDISNQDFSTKLDKLFYDYQSNYNDGLYQKTIEETVSIFNHRIEHLLIANKDYTFKAFFREKRRQESDQILLLKHFEKDSNNFFLVDYFFYVKQLFDIIQQNEIDVIWASLNVSDRFQEAKRHFTNIPEIRINIDTGIDEVGEYVHSFARLILNLANYFIERVYSADLETLDDEDKYLFLILWMIFQSGDNYMFINNRSYEKMRDVIMSFKKDLNM